MKEDTLCTSYLQELEELMKQVTLSNDELAASIVIAGIGYQSALAKYAREGKNKRGYSELISNYEEYRDIVLEYLNKK